MTIKSKITSIIKGFIKVCLLAIISGILGTGFSYYVYTNGAESIPIVRNISYFNEARNKETVNFFEHQNEETKDKP